MLSIGFALGNPDSKEGFWFLADAVPPGEVTPRISGRLFDRQGAFLVEIQKGEIVQNPGNCVLQTFSGGMRLLYPSGDTLLNVSTQVFTNGYMTRIQATLYDETGTLRAEPSHDSIKVHGDLKLTIE